MAMEIDRLWDILFVEGRQGKAEPKRKDVCSIDFLETQEITVKVQMARSKTTKTAKVR